MEPLGSDRELVGSYAREGSESAFRALVSRHVNLVFATAWRQVGDRGLAEEITQNTFMALARKAPSLASHETIAGWLHRTAILEAKLRIRTELRRQRREDIAAQFSQIESSGIPTTQDLLPLLDEGLIQLRESERLAIVLRFLEGLSLAEVGSTLGVSEEAARKRVDRALTRLTKFFRVRGFPLAGAASTTLLTHAAQVAPTGLATNAANAALLAAASTSASAGAGALTTWFASWTGLTKTQAIVAGVILGSMPLGWSLVQQRTEAQSRISIQAQLGAGRDALAMLGANVETLRAQVQRERQNQLDASAQRKSSQSPATPPTAPSMHRWDDASPVVRVPKEFLKQLEIYGVQDHRGTLSEALIEALQLKAHEVASIQAALGRFVEGCQAAEAKGLQRVEPNAEDLKWEPSGNVRVFTITDTQAELAASRSTLFEELHQVLDDPRVELLKKSLKDWMPLDDAARGLNSSQAFQTFARRVWFYPYTQQPSSAPGEAVLGWGLRSTRDGQMSITIRVRDIPSYLHPHLQDWMDDAERLNAEGIRTKENKP